MSLIRKRFKLSKKNVRDISRRLVDFGFTLTLKEDLEYLELRSGEKLYLLRNKPLIIEMGNEYIPSLFSCNLFKLPVIWVNHGATPHIINGADLMAPGVVKVVGQLAEGKVAVVTEQSKNIPLAIVKVLGNWDEMLRVGRGKIARNIHHINDKVWRAVMEVMKEEKHVLSIPKIELMLDDSE